MIIALTGSSGSIGRELTPFLSALGHQVIIISSSIPSNNIDCFTYLQLQDKLIPTHVDLFIHLASLNAGLSMKNIQDEIKLTEQVLNSLPALKCSKLIFFSTSKVYGDNCLDFKIHDELSELEPVCSYGKAKKLCEELIYNKSESLQVNTLIFRLPPVLDYSKSGNVGRLIKIASKDRQMLSFAHGETNRRSFISFNNIKTVFEYTLNNLSLLKKNEIYNLSDDSSISLNELLRAGGATKIYSLPYLFGKIILKLPILKNIFIKLYGNFILENTKIKNDMSIKLETTAKSLPIMYK